MEDVKRRLDRLERQLEKYFDTADNLHRGYEKRLGELERKGDARDERLNSHAEAVKALGKQIDRLEGTLLQEFKISQDIMKSMLDHEWQIDKAKMDMKHEIERREAEYLSEAKSLELKMKQERAAFRREMYFKAGAIGLPVLTALATGLSFLIQGFFEK